MHSSFFLSLLAITQLLGAAAIPLRLPSRESIGATILDAPKIFYARTDYPEMLFPDNLSQSSREEIRETFRNQYDKLPDAHPIREMSMHVKVDSDWVKGRDEVREHVMAQFYDGYLQKKGGLAGPPIGEPVKIDRDITMDFGSLVPAEDKASIERAVRGKHRSFHADHPAKRAQLASVGQGWHLPQGRRGRPQIFVQFHPYPLSHPFNPTLERHYTLNRVRGPTRNPSRSGRVRM